MTKQEIIEEIVTLDQEIEREFQQIEKIYQDLKADTAKKDNWIAVLKERSK